ncbi:Sodium/hydrogen exchanger [Tothia fuscella]|uniref:Sodium/hydrogen exchanger n=1 Tax=Tothia fuscella TaxID=1048955 RepID=A0A9P4P246_9PEZI|nr:Sodium/hydrogen exchanger [Tothia fuscella]
MGWKQLEPSGPHLTYLLLSSFLIFYALFSSFIRNRLHLSEPPLATIVGIILGPRGANIFTPEKWGYGDDVVQELTRVIVGIQCFDVGVELPRKYLRPHLQSLMILLGPVMTTGWLVVAAFLYLILKTDISTSLVIAACLTPTDPVLAASVLSNSQFSTRVPSRIRRLLSAESGCNDGVAFPFLYAGLSILTRATFASAAKKWILITILWQCGLGIFVGIIIGHTANKLLHYSDDKGYVGRPSYVAFYLLLALFSVGVASTLGVDDFLVAFSAGAAFSHDGVFAEATEGSSLGNIIDLLLNSTMFVFFGSIIPWSDFNMKWPDPDVMAVVTPWRLFGLLVLILLFRRIPAVLALKGVIPEIYTWPEAFFVGHFGPMGVGALFLAIEARAQLETDSSEAQPHPTPPGELPARNQTCMEMIWPVICFIVLGSTMVHGLSTLFVSLWIHFRRHETERAPLMGGETENIGGMVHSDDESDG